MSKDINVRKRNGKLEKLNIEKIHKVLEQATEGYDNSAISEIELNANLSFYDGITTEEIHNLLIRSANDLISEDRADYQYIAAKLLLIWVRKQVWGGSEPPRLLEHIQKNVDRGIYDKFVLEKYTETEIHKINKLINHERDFSFAYAGLQQLVDKYLCQDRSTGQLFETPQFAFILISMTLFAEYPEDSRMSYIKKAYDYISRFKINLPTPLLAGVRTPIKQYASCCLIDVDDSMEGIMSAVTSVAYYTAKRSGIGINIGRIRPIGEPIRGGEVISTGVLPFLKVFESTVKSCSQNGIRGGSSTVNYPWWHYEAMEMMVLKNNGGTDENRVRKLDYVIQLSKLAYERLIHDDYLTLFSPNEAKQLYDFFGLPEFDEMYKKYEEDNSIKFKKRVKAKDFFELFARERIETGRQYVFNIDLANLYGSFRNDIIIDGKPQRIHMTNLCVEISHVTKPQKHIDQDDAEIGVCILSAINLLEIKDFNELESVCDIVVRLLDSVIDHQTYPIKAAENFAKNRRSIGVGVTNLAGLLASHKIKYSDKESLLLVDEWMEAIQYNLLKASCNLAKEKGTCNKFNLTKYSQGILPIDNYTKFIDTIVTRPYTFNWELLRADIIKYGLRHSTLTAVMPVESSSVVSNSTSGIDCPRNNLSIKKSKKGTLKQIVPEYKKYKSYYTKAFDVKDNTDMLNICGVISKWIDMSISANVYYNYELFDDGEIPLSVIIKDMLYAYRLGIKSLYYANSYDGNKDLDFDSDKNDDCASGACKL